MSDNPLDDLNARWQGQDHPYAAPGDTGWTMTCPSCRITVGDGKITLVDAMNRAIRHRRNGCSDPVPAEG